MTGGPDINNLFPAIAQSFAVILIGYLFGRFKIIPPGESRALSELVAKLALPALLFRNLAVLDLSTISWPFMAGILISKAAVFIVVTILTLIVSRPVNIGKAGLFGIFATQSNDFALGLPIVQALYSNPGEALGNFTYISYIYLLAPVSLLIVNPVGFLMMEYSKQSHRTRVSWRHLPNILGRTVRGVMFTPVIFMTAFGIIWNVVAHFVVNGSDAAYSANLPGWLAGFLDVLGGAYAALALFQIGIFMVGKLQKLTGFVLLIAFLLIAAKIIVLPMVAYRILYALLPNGADNSTREDIATFGFLYGTFPTAPTVFVFASQYNLAMEIIASSIVLCTFVSAPLMYLSARMVLITYASESHYSHIIENTRRDVTIIALVSMLWVFTVFLLARRYRSFIHVIIMHLLAAMFLEVLGGELLDLYGKRKDINWEYFWFSIFFIGVLATRIWAAWLALGLSLLLLGGPRVAERAWLPMMFSAWGISIVITVTMVGIQATKNAHLHGNELVDVSFLFGRAQLIATMVVLLASFTIGVIFLVVTIFAARRLRERRDSRPDIASSEVRQQKRETTPKPQASPGIAVPTTRRRPMTINYGSDSLSTHSSVTSANGVYGRAPLYSSSLPESEPPREELLLDTREESREAAVEASQDKLSSVQKEPTIREEANETTPLLKSTNSRVSEASGFGTIPSSGMWDKDISGKHITRFVVLLMCLLFSCLVGILIVIWKLTTSQISGIFIAVNVLDTVTNFGQAFFVFAVFGFEKHWFWVAIFNRLRRAWFRIETVVLPQEEELSMDVVNLCSTFKAQYLQACKRDILSDKRYYFRVYESVFTGSDLVDWLLQKGLVEAREDAVQYGHSLMLGRVVAHVMEEHYFHDDNYFYRFLV